MTHTVIEVDVDDFSLYLFNTGEAHHSYRMFGAHPMNINGIDGVRFAVWAPQAVQVSVVGDFNEWHTSSHILHHVKHGVFMGFVPYLEQGALYKYAILSEQGKWTFKADPYAFFSERRPQTASIVYGLQPFNWTDYEWMMKRSAAYNAPLLIYEVHAGSWKIKGKENFYTYSELEYELIPYVKQFGFTHIELLPIMEHPLDQSWGYQLTGYYSPTSRYGRPEQLKSFINACHLAHIGVVLDWVPGHFCKDEHGLRLFDGKPLYEGPNLLRAELPLWGTLSFDFNIAEVRSFLISNAVYWFEQFHIDGIRVDAVANMLDLHMDKPPELQTLNEHGGHINLHAISFLQQLNKTIFHYYPQALMIAEDSSTIATNTKPAHEGGLGFNYKWNMGWMNDSLTYLSLSPYERRSKHHLLTFSIWYAFSENYVLPLSHDEVVHGKKSLLNKMWGSYEQKFAQLRMFYGYWITHPGKKLLFMGSEWGQFDEWKDQDMLDWSVLQYPAHDAMSLYVKTLFHTYLSLPSIWQQDTNPSTFSWIDVNNADQQVLAYERNNGKQWSVILLNFSDQYYEKFKIGVTHQGQYKLILNSNEARYGGHDSSEQLSIASEPYQLHGRDNCINVQLPPFTFKLFTFIGGTI